MDDTTTPSLYMDDEGEALANIHDAIREYLSVVTELLGEAEIRQIDVAV